MVGLAGGKGSAVVGLAGGKRSAVVGLAARPGCDGVKVERGRNTRGYAHKKSTPLEIKRRNMVERSLSTRWNVGPWEGVVQGSPRSGQRRYG
jgi:hypothetical protein